MIETNKKTSFTKLCLDNIANTYFLQSFIFGYSQRKYLLDKNGSHNFIILKKSSSILSKGSYNKQTHQNACICLALFLLTILQ